MTIDKEQTVAKTVAEDFRTAAVFSKYGIDFCCKGGRSISSVCEDKEVEMDILLNELKEVVSAQSNSGMDYLHMPEDLLADILEKKYHREIREKTPVILAYLEKVVKVHGEHNPEVKDIFNLFFESSIDLENHMRKEEMVLFPIARNLHHTNRVMSEIEKQVESPISVMHMEHEKEGDRFREISRLSSSYTPPEHACNTYRVAYQMLQAFEKDLHEHIHIENNILFPKLVAASKAM